jgi:hypothetical protein
VVGTEVLVERAIAGRLPELGIDASRLDGVPFLGVA